MCYAMLSRYNRAPHSKCDKFSDRIVCFPIGLCIYIYIYMDWKDDMATSIAMWRLCPYCSDERRTDAYGIRWWRKRKWRNCHNLEFNLQNVMWYRKYRIILRRRRRRRNNDDDDDDGKPNSFCSVRYTGAPNTLKWISELCFATRVCDCLIQNRMLWVLLLR